MSRIFTKVESAGKTGKAVKSSKDPKDLASKINKWIAAGESWCSDIHDRAEENNSYAAGTAMWTKEDYDRQVRREKPALVLNKVMPALNAIANREIMERYQIKVYGRDRTLEDGAYAEIGSEFIRWQRDAGGVEHEESRAFRSMVSGGYSCVHTYWDDLEDSGRGRIMSEEIPVWWMLWDPRARKMNLSDRRWHLCGKYISKHEAFEEYGDIPQFRDKMTSVFGDDSLSIKTSTRWPWSEVAQGFWYNEADDEVFCVEAEWQDLKVNYIAAVPLYMGELATLKADPTYQVFFDQDGNFVPMDAVAEMAPEDAAMLTPITGAQVTQLEDQDLTMIEESILDQTQAVELETLKDLEAVRIQYMQATGQDFTGYHRNRRYVTRFAIMIGDVIVDEGERPQGFTYEFMTGFPVSSREGMSFIGFVDLAKGPQDFRNRFMSLVLSRLATSPKASFLFEEGSIRDLDQFLDAVANPGGAIPVPDGFLQSNRFHVLPQPTFPPLERELIGMVDQSVNEIAGLSGIDTGQQQDLRRISGNVVSQVKQASNTILALLFDSLRLYRRRQGLLVMKMMGIFYTPEEVVRIVGNEKTENVDLSGDWGDITRFDIKIDEAPSSVTERLEMFDYLTRTGTLEAWVAQGLLPPDLVFEWFPYLSESDRIKIREFRAANDQNVQQAQQYQSLYEFIMTLPDGETLIQEFTMQQQVQEMAPQAPVN